ncbi:PfkB family carbohydrate kinase [Microbacterium oryzae]|uniref:PfkB family carbohydrate kinase n=1 Tax=Microbacterium oryzae TaxID=743009 RepID=UPI0025AF88DB|nr:PfkB family carbohydrate kinase [Microbacterium oryzae]MDN3309409.1 PfkB family carbohydrate kinase [Microbacterium oryzae]
MSAGAHPQALRPSIAVIGQAGRDLVLQVDDLPEAGASAPVTQRIERVGGKGASMAIGIRQLNPDVRPTLLAVLGSDAAGDQLHHEAVAAGLDVAHVTRRGRTALMVDVVAAGGERRLLEDAPEESLLTTDDVARASDALERADVVVLQLQQPAPALLAAARLASHACIVLDGAVTGPERGELLELADVVRADAHEAELLTGTRIRTREDASRAAVRLLTGRTTLVALSVPGEGDLISWRGGEEFHPHGEAEIVDATGAGDAFVAGLVTGVRRGESPQRTGQLAADCAAATVQRLGGRPDLTALGAGV